ncbi:MAG: DUF3253 domain-containing protein [Solirubrobacteraceae bacterium]|nr:DUF3253 domain-containing protein [Solirubrobacteraceae bacterium]
MSEPSTQPGSDDEVALEAAIVELLAERSPGATICPSEAARRVGGEAPDGTAAGDEPWRALMEPARIAAQRLVDAGEIDVVQDGEPVDLATASGPIRLRLRAPS